MVFIFQFVNVVYHIDLFSILHAKYNSQHKVGNQQLWIESNVCVCVCVCMHVCIYTQTCDQIKIIQYRYTYNGKSAYRNQGGFTEE